MHADIYKRLVHAKLILDRAGSMLSRSTDLDISVALLLAHDAIELLMLAVLDHVGAPSKKKREFLSFWQDMKQIGKQEPPDYGAMESLNRLRVGLKHSGIIPNPKVVSELFARAKGFFENVLRLYCSLEYTSLSLLERIPDEDVRALIVKARAEFANGSKNEAMCAFAAALAKIERPRGRYIPRLVAPETPDVPRELRGMGFVNYFKSLHAFLHASAALLNAQTFGFDSQQFRSFRRIFPLALQSFSGEFQFHLWTSYEELDKDAFEKIDDYLIGYAIKVFDASQKESTAFRHPNLDSLVRDLP